MHICVFQEPKIPETTISRDNKAVWAGVSVFKFGTPPPRIPRELGELRRLVALWCPKSES